MTGIPGEPRQPESDRAKGRFLVIQMLRVSGVAMVLFGLLVINRKVDLPALAGYGLLAVGLLDVFLMPAVLAKLWKTPLP